MDGKEILTFYKRLRDGNHSSLEKNKHNMVKYVRKSRRLHAPYAIKRRKEMIKILEDLGVPFENIEPFAEADAVLEAEIAALPVPIPSAPPSPLPIPIPSAPAPVEDAPLPPIDTFCDPISCEPISGPDALAQIEKRVRDEITKQRKEKHKDYSVMKNFGKLSRLDLLIQFLNANIIDDRLLEVIDESGNQKAPQLFEGYWDIVIALGRLSSFEMSEGRVMFNGKIEALSEIILKPETSHYNNGVFEYLENSPVATSSVRGASDITVFFMDKEQTDLCATGTCATQQGDEDPCSETLVTRSTKPRVYLCSSKFFGKEKSIDKYDIQNIWTAIKPALDIEKHIVLLVRDSTHLRGKIIRATRQYLSGKIVKIFGWNDCLASLRAIHENIQSQKLAFGISEVTKENIAALFGISSVKPPRPFLSLFLHQKMTVDFIVDKIRGNPAQPRFLVGILPRGGKTYIAGGIIRDLRPRRALVVLGAKTETQSQFINELFDSRRCGFQDFADYTVADVLDWRRPLESGKKYIFVCSTENLKMKRTGPAKDKAAFNLINELIKSGLDLILIDEAHQKLLTKRGEKAFSSDTADAAEGTEVAGKDDDFIVLPVEKTPTVFMTGTYSKFLSRVLAPSFAVPSDQMIIWDYEDVQLAKNLEDPEIQTEFRVRFGEFFTRAFEHNIKAGKTAAQIAAVYRKFPILYLLTTNFTEDVRRVEQPERGMPNIVASQEGIAFEYKGREASEWWRGLARPADMMRIINYLGPSGITAGQLDDTDILPTSSVMDRVDRIAQRVGDRMANVTSGFVPHSQLWFLARSARGQQIEKRMPALASLILRHPWFFKHFDVMCVTASVNWAKFADILPESRYFEVGAARIIFACPDTKVPLKECICSYENASRKRGRGLIILAEGMLKLGISLPCVNIVALLDDAAGLDDRIQKMYRALTQAPYKTAGFIIDLNPRRTVTALIDYQILKAKHAKGRDVSVEELDTEILGRVLDAYQIDDDLPVFAATEEEGSQVRELKKLYNPKLYSSGSFEEAGKLLNSEINAGNVYIEGFNNALGQFREEKKKTEAVRENEAGVPVAPDVALPSVAGKGVGKKGKVDEDKLGRAEELHRIQKDIVKTTLKFAAFGSGLKTVVDITIALRADSEFQGALLETLFRRGLIATTDSELIESLIIPLLEKSLGDKQGELYAMMRGRINSADDSRIKEVLDYITDHLAPKDLERHKYGEVFTPLTLVDEMLATLPTEVWAKKDWKWLDPANGIGNFPIKALLGQTEGAHTYPGLIHGLEKEIPDAGRRCKHIVENMLFMVDINPKNNAIARRLFEKLCPGARANIDQIDRKDGFLSAKPLVFNGKEVAGFDVIMGNPPYNAGGILKGGGALWPKFVKKAMERIQEKGYIVFIHPPGWRKFYDPEDRESQGKLLYDIMQRKWSIDYINISDKPSKHFPIVDFYTIRAKATESPTNYKSEFLGIQNKGKADLTGLSFIPNMLNDETLNIIKKLFAMKGAALNIVYNQSFKPTADNKVKEGVAHYHFTNRHGQKEFYYKKYDVVPEYVTQPKVVMTFKAGYEKGRLFAFFTNEPVGTTNNSMYMIVKSESEGEKLVKFLNSNLITFLLKITQYSSPPNHINEYKILNKLKMPESINDYHLAEKESALINTVVQEKAAKKNKTYKSNGNKMRLQGVFAKTRKLRH